MSRPDNPTLEERLQALANVTEVATGRLGATAVGDATAIADKVSARLRHGTEHTVVAVAGATGVGKSSLFNALVGAEVSTPGVRRPTTSAAHAAIWGEGNAALLDWLRVGHRHHLEESMDGTGDGWRGLILIDLPDFDSVAEANRGEVDRLVELVDMLIWVTDPQKYADEAFHDGYIRPLAEHRDVMRFVLNKIDTVPAAQHPELAADFARRLRDDGIEQVEIVPISVTADAGLDAVRSVLSDSVAQRRAMVDRLTADLANVGNDVAERLGIDDSTPELSKGARHDLTERLGEAAGVGAAAEVVAAQHHHDARRAMGWPPAKLVGRWRRRQPITQLPRVTTSPAARSAVDLALRDAAEDAGSDLPTPWPATLRTAADATADDLTARLTSTVQTTARDAGRAPRWWAGVQQLQRVLMIVAAVGGAWLLGLAILGGLLRLDTEPLLIDTPGAEWIPLPTLLLLGGLLVSLIVAFVVRFPVSFGARRRAMSAKRQLLSAVDDVAQQTVIADLDQVLADRRLMHQHLDVLRAI